MSIDRKSIFTSGSKSVMPAATVYDRFAPALLGLCRRYCGNIEDAEDILHDGFVKILQNLEKFEQRSNGSFEGWMKRIMINTALNHIRSKSRERDLFDFNTPPEETSTQNTEEDHFFIQTIAEKVSKEQLIDMIGALPVGYRTVFNLYVFESYSHKEIAEALGCSENTSKSQLSKARSLLRKQLEQVLTKITVQQ